MHRNALTSLAAVAICATASAQFNETEPNSGKSEATVIGPIGTGSTYDGTSTGNGTTLGDASVTTADYFRLELGSGLIGIYCYTDDKSSPILGHTFSIRGVNQVGGVPGTNDVAVQVASAATAVPYEEVWYGYCRGDKHYSRVDGTPPTTFPYHADITCTPIRPRIVPVAFQPGTITVTTIGQGHSTDTEIYVFDSTLTPVSGGHDDDSLSPASLQSRVTLNLPPGSYVIAVSDYNTCNNLSDSNPNEAFLSGNLLDFPDCIVNSSTATNVNVSFSVSDGITTIPVAATKVNAFEIFWARFFVGATGVPFCFGDGTGAACPCGNTGAPGNGCANSLVAAGGRLAATGNTSVSADTAILFGTNMPNSFVLYFQGTTQLAGGLGAPFGDGLRCAGGTLIRLATKLNVANSSSFPQLGDVALSVKGAIPPGGGTRTYQGWYRDASPVFCTASTFNLTNGVQLAWTP